MPDQIWSTSWDSQERLWREPEKDWENLEISAIWYLERLWEIATRHNSNNALCFKRDQKFSLPSLSCKYTAYLYEAGWSLLCIG